MAINKPIDFDEQEYVLEQLPVLGLRIVRHSDRWNFRCPICGDSKKSVTKARGNYYPRTNSYHCFNCHADAHGLGVLSSLSGAPYHQIVSEFMKWKVENKRQLSHSKPKINLVLEEIKKPRVEFEIKEDWIELPPKVYEYIEKRLIFKAPYKPENFKLYFNNKTKRIVIPWYSYTKLMYYQERAIHPSQNPKYLFPKDTEKPIFNIDNINPDKRYVFYTEGVFDSIFAENCIAVGGINLTESQRDELGRRSILDKLVWIPDNPWVDDSAKNEIIRVCKKNPNLKIYEWKSDNNAKDINESILQNKVNEFSFDSLREHLIQIDKFVVTLELF